MSNRDLDGVHKNDERSMMSFYDESSVDRFRSVHMWYQVARNEVRPNE